MYMKTRARDRANSGFNSSTIALGFLLLFFFQPFLAFVALVAIGLMNDKNSSRFIYFVAFLGACYLGLVNTTKLPDSDYVIYLEWYSNAQELSLPDFFALYTREPLYYLYLYAIANVPYSSEHLFVFTSTVISYCVFMFGVIRGSIGSGLHNRVIISFVVALMFFAPLFNLSAHLMRQFIAGSLVIFFFSEIIFSGKKHWWILVAAVFVHISAIIFFPLAMIGKTNSVSTRIGFFLLFVLYYITKYAASVFSDIPLIGFVFNRIAEQEWAELGFLNFASIIFIIFILLLSVSNLMASKRVLNANVSVYGGGINVSVTMLCVLVLAANMQDGTSEIALRFFFYSYFFMGLVMPMFVASYRKLTLLIFPLLVLSIPYFFYNSKFGTWEYASLFDLLFSPAWELWNYRI